MMGCPGESKVITYKIAPDGQSVEIDGQGFHGSGCIEAAKATMAAIGGPAKVEKKAEYYEEAHMHCKI